MTDTLYPPIQPSTQGTQGDVKPRLITNTFGDGYKQDTPDGLNPILRTPTIVWDAILATDADTICQFLDAHVGVPFAFTLPRELAPRTWIWTSRQRTYPGPTTDALTVMLEERFVY
jgi:phage-related protein